MWKKYCKFHCFFQQLEVWTKKLTEYKSKKSLVGFSSKTNAFIISDKFGRIIILYVSKPKLAFQQNKPKKLKIPDQSWVQQSV